MISSLPIAKTFSSNFLFSENVEVDNWLGELGLLDQTKSLDCKTLIGNRFDDDLLSSRYCSSKFILLTRKSFREMSLWASATLFSNAFDCIELVFMADFPFIDGTFLCDLCCTSNWPSLSCSLMYPLSSSSSTPFDNPFWVEWLRGQRRPGQPTASLLVGPNGDALQQQTQSSHQVFGDYSTETVPLLQPLYPRDNKDNIEKGKVFTPTIQTQLNGYLVGDIIHGYQGHIIIVIFKFTFSYHFIETANLKSQLFHNNFFAYKFCDGWYL